MTFPPAARRFTPSILPAIAMLLLALAPAAHGQISVSGPAGVMIEPDGTLRHRAVDAHGELAVMRARAKAAAEAAKEDRPGFVSLPKAFAQARAAAQAGQEIPADVKYLGGLTRIDYVFVFEDEKDLVIAGPVEAVEVIDAHTAVGRRTGRPVLHLEDLVVAMRAVRSSRGQGFGCTIDPDPMAPQRLAEAMKDAGRMSRSARLRAALKAIGPQQVKFVGTIPPDTRLALAIVSADYELKRYVLGQARTTVSNLGSGVDNSRAAANRFWFELAYDPILVSPSGDAYAFRGPRLMLQAGAFDWDARGATPRAMEFARRFSRHFPELAAQQPLFAELQNAADISVLAALIQKDRLDRKVGWDTSWLLSHATEAAPAFPLTQVPTPRTAEPLANLTGGAIAAGGVLMSPMRLVDARRESDREGVLDAARQRATLLLRGSPGAAITAEPSPDTASAAGNAGGIDD